MNTEYEIGTHIDLTYLNKKVVAPATFTETVSNLMDVGTQISFKRVGESFRTVRHIPVIAL